VVGFFTPGQPVVPLQRFSAFLQRQHNGAETFAEKQLDSLYWPRHLMAQGLRASSAWLPVRSRKKP
jgi:hypothetical protein